jgi:hypothetical protein
VRKKCGQKANAFFSKFATPVTGANASFVDPFAINAVAIAPIIDLGEHIYVPNLAGLPASIASSACQGMPKPYRIPYNIDADQSSTKDRALRRAAASTTR